LHTTKLIFFYLPIVDKQLVKIGVDFAIINFYF
jgi:hypothetical protein